MKCEHCNKEIEKYVEPIEVFTHFGNKRIYLCEICKDKHYSQSSGGLEYYDD